MTPKQIQLGEIQGTMNAVSARRIEVIRLQNEGLEGRRFEIQRRRVTELTELLILEQKRLSDMEATVANAAELIDGFDARLAELRQEKAICAKAALIERMQKMMREMREMGMGNPMAVPEEMIS